MRLRRLFATTALCALLLAPGNSLAQRSEVAAGDWQGYGRDVAGTRFSPLSEITPANVGGLGESWRFDFKPADDTSARLLVSQMTPIAIGGVIYLPTPYGRIVALDGDTGATIWSYTLPDDDTVSGRGIQYWPGARGVGPRIFYGTRSGKLEALDVKTGKPAEGFAPINMRTPDVIKAFPDISYGINSAPIVFADVVITGAKVQEFPALGPSGDVRGWDAVTGRLRWTFHAIPQPGEPGYGTWETGSENRSGVNVWSLMTVDRERGIVYLPFAAPTYDRVGIDRKGANLFSSSLVAVNARTGKYLWHFQALHHDIWDHDMPGQPTLLTVKRNGRNIPAVAAVNKTGYIFLLDRRNGKPIYDVEERPVPPSSVPGEEAWPTQPFPVAPPPITRQSMTIDDVTDITPEHREFCLGQIRNNNLTFLAPFEPIRSDRPTIRFPGPNGGPNWGGGAFDVERGLYIINTNEMAAIEQVAQNAQGNWTNVARIPFNSQGRGLLCHKPPWGALHAIDVNAGTIVWEIPLGVSDQAPPGKQLTGRPNYGGPILTTTGLTFIGASDDARFRAFETATGKQLWEVNVGAAAHSTPITYTGRSGRQYVGVVAAGGSALGSPANVSRFVRFALPKTTP